MLVRSDSNFHLDSLIIIPFFFSQYSKYVISKYVFLIYLFAINKNIFLSLDFMVTCCGDQSVNSLVQSFNMYPPSFAVYLIGRSLLPQGQTLNSMYNSTSKLVSSYIIFFFFIMSIIFKQIQHF
jgi:hypothetical protein